MKTFTPCLAKMLVISLFALSGVLAQNPGDSVFAGIKVHTIQLQFNQANYWDSLAYYYSLGTEQNIVAKVTINGVVTDSVGVRLKGNSSYSHPNNKKSIRLSFDEYLDGQRWDGLKGVHLNNCWGDPSFMREKMYLDFCRDAGIPAPRANYAVVYINNQMWGLYSLVEHVDKTFLETRYGDKSGNLYKAVDGFGMGPQVFSDFRWYGSKVDTYKVRYELKTEESLTPWTDIVSVIDTLANSKSIASSYGKKINLIAAARAFAADNIFSNLDSYLNSARNFYAYFNPLGGKLEWIVWDTGLSFGAYSGGVSSLENLSITYVSSISARPLLGKIINTPYLKNEYLKAYHTLFTNFFSTGKLLARADSIANTIRPLVTVDPKKMYTTTQFEQNITGNINASGGGGTLKYGIKSFIQNRYTNVSSQLASAGINWKTVLQPGDVVINEFMAQNDSILDPASEPEDWIELYNTTNADINLGGLYLSDSYSFRTKWKFPDSTIIPAKKYLIVWADEDSGQAGVHAGFKLSASGEQLILTNTDTSMVADSVSFGAQGTNVSQSRIANGTGPFFMTKPTFNAENSAAGILTSPVMTTTILPQYIQGNTGTNSNRIPYAYRAKFNGLLPNATYRYLNQFVISTDAGSSGGSGNCLFPSLSGNFVRTSSPSLATAGAYGTFVTDGSGGYEGWFASEPSGNVRFVPGKYIFVRISLNDGASGTTALSRLTSVDSIRVVKLDSLLSDSTGTGLRAITGSPAKDFVFVYDNVAGTGRPLSGTFVENDGTDNSTGNNYASFYSAGVNTVAGAFGVVVPNNLSSGVRRVERRMLSTGAIGGWMGDEDGVWSGGGNTVNPNGGTKEIVLTGLSLLTGVKHNAELPNNYALMQNYPNPFNPSTTIRFSVPSAGLTVLKVYDIVGREIAMPIHEVLNAGSYDVSFNASHLPSGIYFYSLTAGTTTIVKRMVLLK